MGCLMDGPRSAIRNEIARCFHEEAAGDSSFLEGARKGDGSDGLDALDDDRRGHTAARAHGDEADLLVGSLEFVEDRANQD